MMAGSSNASGTPAELPPVATAREVAAYLRCDVETVYAAIASGALRAANVGGSARPSWRIARENVTTWLDQRNNDARAVSCASTRAALSGGHSTPARGAPRSASPSPMSRAKRPTALHVSDTPQPLTLREALGLKPRKARRSPT